MIRNLIISAASLLALGTAAHAETQATLQAGTQGIYAATVNNIKLLLEITSDTDGVRAAKYQILEDGEPVYRGIERELYSVSYGPHFRIVEMDAANDTPEIFISTYSGGAHCCNEVTILTKTANGWRDIGVGSFDGGPENVYPRDVNGDGTAEIVTYDNRFLYQFASYAGSFAPQQILALRGVNMINVSTEEDYQWEIQAGLDRMGDMPDAGEPRNSWLAAYAATLLQLGQDDPLDFAFGRYDETADWGMIRCTVPEVDGVCPDAKQTNIGFEAALTDFLTETGYLKAKK